MRLRLPSVASRLGLIERIRLSPEGHSLDDLKKMTRASLAQGQRFFMLTYHSSSLLVGGTPYVSTEADRQTLLATLAGYLEFFREECGGHPEALSHCKAQLVEMSSGRWSQAVATPGPPLAVRLSGEEL